MHSFQNDQIIRVFGHANPEIREEAQKLNSEESAYHKKGSSDE
jgi:hypothetical protein